MGCHFLLQHSRIVPGNDSAWLGILHLPLCTHPLFFILFWNGEVDIHCCCLAAQSCLTLGDSMDCSSQAPLSTGFPRQEHWSGSPFPSPGDLPGPGIEPVPLALAGRFFTTVLLGMPVTCINKTLISGQVLTMRGAGRRRGRSAFLPLPLLG